MSAIGRARMDVLRLTCGSCGSGVSHEEEKDMDYFRACCHVGWEEDHLDIHGLKQSIYI
jgi:hypothetical protein